MNVSEEGLKKQHVTRGETCDGIQDMCVEAAWESLSFLLFYSSLLLCLWCRWSSWCSWSCAGGTALPFNLLHGEQREREEKRDEMLEASWRWVHRPSQIASHPPGIGISNRRHSVRHWRQRFYEKTVGSSVTAVVNHWMKQQTVYWVQTWDKRQIDISLSPHILENGVPSFYIPITRPSSRNNMFKPTHLNRAHNQSQFLWLGMDGEIVWEFACHPNDLMEWIPMIPVIVQRHCFPCRWILLPLLLLFLTMFQLLMSWHSDASGKWFLLFHTHTESEQCTAGDDEMREREESTWQECSEVHVTDTWRVRWKRESRVECEERHRKHAVQAFELTVRRQKREEKDDHHVINQWIYIKCLLSVAVCVNDWRFLRHPWKRDRESYMLPMDHIHDPRGRNSQSEPISDRIE